MTRLPSIDQSREFLRDTIRQQIDFSGTDQQRGVPRPPVQKPIPAEAARFDLPRPDAWQLGTLPDLQTVIGSRRSWRSFRDESLALDELAFLLWATQGVRQGAAPNVFRTVPSAGCRHALETYLCLFNVAGLAPGFYRYLPLEHQLVWEFSETQVHRKLTAATLGQAFVARAAAVFFWTTLPYRMEWRYGRAAHRVIALDAGHVCQNLYLASTAIGAGTCAVAAYDQQAMDRLLRVDGRDEFTLYLAPVGKV